MSYRVFVYFYVCIDVQYFAVALLFSFLCNVLYQVVPVASNNRIKTHSDTQQSRSDTNYCTSTLCM